jgi:type VI secretion system protein ImpH
VSQATPPSSDFSTDPPPPDASAPPHSDAAALSPAIAELFAQLAAEPFTFDFFQAVRRLECASPRLPRIGTSTRAEQDPARFIQKPSLAFAPSVVAAFDLPTPDGLPARMAVNFIGLWGPNGPLPLHLTEYARDRERNSNDATLTRFADVFHHRMASLFYRAWAVNQQAVGADRSLMPDGSDADPLISQEIDRFAVYVASFIGRGTPSLRQRDSVPDNAKLHWSGHLSGETAHAEGLEAILSGHFATPCKVLPFTGQWIDIPDESRCLLGRSPDTGALGRTSIVGAHVWDCQGKFTIRLGPMNLDKFNRMLPLQSGNRELRDWIRNYIGDQLAWEARIVLAESAIPGIRLNGATQLGLSTWLPTAGPRRDVDDLVLHS